jgi:3-oxoacyl-[acyl-carrier protein] reductase
MGKLSNKIAVVTGASKGIGAGIAKQLAAEGASVVVNYSTGKYDAEKVVGEIVARGGNAVAVGANIANENEVSKLFDETKSLYGHLDILVNNAGVFGMGPIEALSLEEYQRVFDTNVRGLMLSIKAASPLFPKSGGAVINISSSVSTTAPAFLSLYSATKGAVDTITKVLAKEFGPRNIRINAINPGLVITEGTKAAGIPGSPMEQQVIAMTPLGRAALPEDIALPAAFLASDDARYITGVTLMVSGGAGI